MLYTERQTIDTRTPFQKVRRTTLYRYLNLNGVNCSDNDTVEKLRNMVLDAGLGVPDVEKVNQAWFKREKKEPKELKRPDLVKKASELGIESPMKMTNEQLREAISVEDAA